MKRTKDIFLEQREKETMEGRFDNLNHQLNQEHLYQQLKFKTNEIRLQQNSKKSK